MIVPGSQFNINHPFSWYVIFKDKTDGRQLTMWLNGSQKTREEVVDHLAIHYHNIEVITVDQCTTQPTRMLVPVPPHLFQFGILEAMRKFGQDPERIERKPIVRKPLSRQSLAR